MEKELAKKRAKELCSRLTLKEKISSFRKPHSDTSQAV